ncbi:helix-turn-helix transcriptional regulator [Sulfitobacter albidus]|uniref:Helix-turn-helix transcriptional regulator n=1 Tax=Sulfitobacter albidus TaxID=2829501 RepID=A0A975JDY0_9RHOB|nr:helix-turn-helix transcriptional regulator [Sulfitobacter albidus]QUJ76709.1 helix-turn-helix transcriptional regulator [Sulfitobacter albidus]
MNDLTDVMPFHGATDLHARIAQALALVTDWNGALAGHLPISSVLSVFARQCGAANAEVLRLARDRVLPVAAVVGDLDRTQPTLSSGRLLRYLRDTRLDTLTPGSLWLLSDLMLEDAFSASHAGQEWRARGDLSGVHVIILEATAVQIDAIEMHFARPPKEDPEMPPLLIARALADGWGLRSPGLIARTIRSFGRTRGPVTDEPDGAILGERNRCGLSRSERRVCQLLAGGAKAKDIAEALDISIPTVRTHLRNIYAKTETSGQVELLAMISSERDRQG